jgi:hypothetical protein
MFTCHVIFGMNITNNIVDIPMMLHDNMVDMLKSILCGIYFFKYNITPNKDANYSEF